MDSTEFEYIPIDARQQLSIRFEIIVNGDGNLEIVTLNEPVVTTDI